MFGLKNLFQRRARRIQHIRMPTNVGNSSSTTQVRDRAPRLKAGFREVTEPWCAPKRKTGVKTSNLFVVDVWVLCVWRCRLAVFSVFFRTLTFGVGFSVVVTRLLLDDLATLWSRLRHGLHGRSRSCVGCSSLHQASSVVFGSSSSVSFGWVSTSRPLGL